MNGLELEIGVGIIVAIVTVVAVAKVFITGGADKKRKSEDTPDSIKKQRNEVDNQEKKAQNTSSDEIAKVVTKLSELKDGQMKEVPVEESQILVVKDKEEVYAFGAKCSHLGAPLKSGVFCEGRVRCPWHGACFNAKTGDIEDYPCVDAIHAFPVQVKNDDVIISVPKQSLKTWRRVPKMASPSKEDKRVIAIVGAGPAGLVCAETLRQDGFTGRIVLIGKEKILPYDRTKLSKAMNSKPSQILLRTPEFYTENGIETILGVAVTEFDPKGKTLTMSNGQTLDFDFGVLATGGDPRSLPVSGMTLGNIYQLRVPDESTAIINNVEGKKVVIVGTSFIGMEAAASIAKKAASVVAIGMEKVPFERVLGEQVGTSLQKLHEKNGIQFRMQRVVKEFIGKDGNVAQVVLDNGEILEADICIVGAGIVPATKYVKPDTLEIARDGSIVADKTLKAADGVYVIGDLARFPFHTGELVRVEHYGFAMYQGSVAAHNIMGKKTEVHSVPFFWTTQYGKNIRYAGHALSWDEFMVDGDLENLNFVGYYVRKNEVLAAIAVGRDPVASAVAELMAAGKMPSADNLKLNKFQLPL